MVHYYKMEEFLGQKAIILFENALARLDPSFSDKSIFSYIAITCLYLVFKVELGGFELGKPFVEFLYEVTALSSF